MNDNTYNGWTNYETWNVKLWMDNDAGSYDYYREMAREVLETSAPPDYLTQPEIAAINLADLIKDDFDNANPLGEDASCFSDLLGAALSNVNWHEIAKSILDDLED